MVGVGTTPHKEGDAPQAEIIIERAMRMTDARCMIRLIITSEVNGL
jgi:hypothetical protein